MQKEKLHSSELKMADLSARVHTVDFSSLQLELMENIEDELLVQEV